MASARRKSTPPSARISACSRRFAWAWASLISLQRLTAGLARDFGPHKIRVNCVIPGWVMTQRQIDKWLTPEAEADLMKAQCLKEKVYPEDLARMVLWLAADDSRMVTCRNFFVDGGWL